MDLPHFTCALVVWCLLATLVSTDTEIETLQRDLRTIGRQLMQVQVHIEESKRTTGASGIKAQRSNSIGNRPYDSGVFGEKSLCGIHNHPHNVHTLGMGELVAIINGVEFATRHNDYKMVSKSKTSEDFRATEKIKMSPVPPEVLGKKSVQGQVDEMREWFAAWATQNLTHRDYRPYFKPVLCYLEGMWTFSAEDSIEESFDSDRHHLDASSWLDMQQKVRFCSETGHKSNDENYARLPTTFVTLDGTTPLMAQWNYQILCHQLDDDLPLSRFRVVNDLQTRLKTRLGVTMKDYKNSRNARFQLNADDSETWDTGSSRNWRLLDELMSQIPGLDNYGANLRDEAFGLTAGKYNDASKPLNAAYYHRWYKASITDANGLNIGARGFKDENLYMAMNTQPKIPANEIKVCGKKSCESWSQRWSYSIPLEVVYTTPLPNWNPLNIVYKGEKGSAEADTVERDADGNKRNGDDDPAKAYNGTHHKLYYMTPASFFENEVDRDPADTASDDMFVLDRNGDVQKVKASGHRLFIPTIPGLGTLRQRYPIMPLFQEGTPTWKELEALKDIILNPNAVPLVSDDPSHEPPNYNAEHLDYTKSDVIVDMDAGIFTDVTFRLDLSTDIMDPHIHFVSLSADDMRDIYDSKRYKYNTTVAHGHSHELLIVRVDRTISTFKYTRCDGDRLCADGHRNAIYVV